MGNRSSLLWGIILILLGTLFLFFNLIDVLFHRLDVGFSAWRLWPLALIAAGLAFFLAFLLSWSSREQVVGLLMPATLLATNGLVLLYQTLTGDWDSWRYAWTLEPIAVGGALLLMYVLGGRDRGLLVGGIIVGGIGLLLLVVFGSLWGGVIVRLAGPLLLVCSGLAILLLSLFAALERSSKA